ncbi:tetratricopeptide repeat protein [Longispora urticae]
MGRERLEQAYAAWETQDWKTAAELLEVLAADYPDHAGCPAWLFDAALAHKFRRDWARAYSMGVKAAARVQRGVQEPAYWNLGIAATVLGEWTTARDAWQGFGIDLAPGDGEIVDDFGMTCVRLDEADGSEVVWARRICPTRARVVSIPTASERRFGEIVLHDGAPNGERVVGDQAFPVFDEILLWRTSELSSWTVTVTAPAAVDLEDLIDLFDARGLCAEPAENTRVLCRCCSEGSVTQERVVAPGTQLVWLAGPAGVLDGPLDAWRLAAPGRAWSDLRPAH